MDSKANTQAIDSLLNYETVKYFNNESWEDAALRCAYAEMGSGCGAQPDFTRGTQLRAKRNHCDRGNLTPALAAEGVIDGSMTLGDLVLINAFMLQLYMPLHFLGFVYREIKHSLADMEKMFNLLAENEEIKDKPEAVDLLWEDAAVRFEQVNFNYEPNRQILFDVTFNIPSRP